MSDIQASSANSSFASRKSAVLKNSPQDDLSAMTSVASRRTLFPVYTGHGSPTSSPSCLAQLGRHVTVLGCAAHRLKHLARCTTYRRGPLGLLIIIGLAVNRPLPRAPRAFWERRHLWHRSLRTLPWGPAPSLNRTTGHWHTMKEGSPLFPSPRCGGRRGWGEVSPVYRSSMG